jgi:hypothetical protein
MTKAAAKRRLKECQKKLKNVALEEQFPISTYTNANKAIAIIEKMIKNLK